MDTSRLDPCPFCGEEKIPVYTTNEHHYIGGYSADVVVDCCVTMKEMYGTQSEHDSAEEAKESLIKRWNTRHE